MSLSPAGDDPLGDIEQRKIALEAWKKVVQTQEHFNEICMKVRTLYATVMAALISVYGLLSKQPSAAVDDTIFRVDPILPISIAGVLVTALFYFTDRYWYHNLLLGAVDQGREIEERWKTAIPDISMGSKISDRSPIDLSQRPLLRWVAGWAVSDTRLKTDHKIHSDAKIEIFYKPLLYLTVAIAMGSFLLGGFKIKDSSIASHVISAGQRLLEF